MRKSLLLIAAAAAATISAAAWAQSGRDDRSDNWRDSRDNWREDRGWDRDGGRGGRWERGIMQEGGGHHGRGAGFVLRNGNASVAMRCGSEPMQSCVDAAIRLMDRARSMNTPAPATPPNAPVPQ